MLIGIGNPPHDLYVWSERFILVGWYNFFMRYDGNVRHSETNNIVNTQTIATIDGMERVLCRYYTGKSWYNWFVPTGNSYAEQVIEGLTHFDFHEKSDGKDEINVITVGKVGSGMTYSWNEKWNAYCDLDPEPSGSIVTYEYSSRGTYVCVKDNKIFEVPTKKIF